MDKHGQQSSTHKTAHMSDVWFVSHHQNSHSLCTQQWSRYFLGLICKEHYGKHQGYFSLRSTHVPTSNNLLSYPFLPSLCVSQCSSLMCYLEAAFLKHQFYWCFHRCYKKTTRYSIINQVSEILDFKSCAGVIKASWGPGIGPFILSVFLRWRQQAKFPKPVDHKMLLYEASRETTVLQKILQGILKAVFTGSHSILDTHPGQRTHLCLAVGAG